MISKITFISGFINHKLLWLCSVLRFFNILHTLKYHIARFSHSSFKYGKKIFPFSSFFFARSLACSTHQTWTWLHWKHLHLHVKINMKGCVIWGSFQMMLKKCFCLAFCDTARLICIQENLHNILQLKLNHIFLSSFLDSLLFILECKQAFE